jgi:hypothetical protein
MKIGRELAILAILIVTAFLALQLLFVGFDKANEIYAQRQQMVRR